MSWIDLLDDPRSIRAVYGAHVPSLAGAVLHELRLHRDGPQVIFRIDLPEYPANPPEKWVTQGFTTVQLELVLGGVQNVLVEGLSTDSVVDLELGRAGDHVRTTTSAGSSSVIDVRSRWVSVDRISAYQDTIPAS